jgi:hypothetical protein
MRSPADDAPGATPAPAALRLAARIIDVLPALLLFGLIYVTSLDRLGDVDGCEQLPSDRCEIVAVERTRDDVGGEQLVYVLRSGRVVPADQDTIAVAGSTLLVDPPSAASYVPSFVYALLALGLLPGRTGWTPGRFLLRLRIVGADGRRHGPTSSLRTWALPDGAIALTALVALRAGAPWPVGIAVVLTVVPMTGWILDKVTRTTRIVTVRADASWDRTRRPEPEVPTWDDPVWQDDEAWDAPADADVPDGATDPDPLDPRWDVDRQAYIAWDPDLVAWRQWDDELQSWGPLRD